jgi:hypothetical protein
MVQLRPEFRVTIEQFACEPDVVGRHRRDER